MMEHEYHNLVNFDRIKQYSKFIFLDVDGVLNNIASFDHGEHISLDCTRNLRKVLDAVPDCGIILSSTWRIGLEIQHLSEMFSWFGIYRMVGRTKILDGFRGREIQHFLDNFPVKQYVILDDDSDFLNHQKLFHIKTDAEVGLTEAQAGKVIKILKG